MINRIQQLSPEVANQIAAGEVIERPASVVKELVENSLDAQATVIHIEIEFGGLSLIRVSDNGIGIQADDLTLALSAHATSKITQLVDLYSLHSMGFRGEALASIASVAKVSLCSKPQHQPHAMILRNVNEQLMLEPCARSVGTTIDVCNLFYNAPVRKKFLKTAKSEFLAIENIVKRFALSAPEVEIHLKHNGLKTFELPAASCPKTQLSRIQKLLGKSFVADATELQVESGEIRLTGWISGYEYQRSQNDKLWVYINRRMVKDKLVLHAIKQAYEEILHPGRYPACVLYLSVPASEVDVNVHPTKHEVRFQQPRLIHDLISSQILRVLQGIRKPLPEVAPRQQPVQLREIYTAKPPRPMVSTQYSSWIVMNPNVVLIFIQQTPFLVQLEKLQKHYLNHSLRDKPKPFTNRPILVPMTFLVEDSHWLQEHYQQELLQFGISFDVLSETTVRIQQLPVDLPYLNCSLFLEKLYTAKTILNSEQLLDILINCHCLEAQHISMEQQEELYAYLCTLTAVHPQNSWCLRLDSECCRELLHA